MQDKIIIKGARVHNLKNISVQIPKNKFVVITGLSSNAQPKLWPVILSATVLA